MGRYREKLQIIADILEIAREGARKTRIMYQANLSYRLLCSYLVKVLEAGLVEGDDDDCYVLTSKGEAFLSKYAMYAKLCRGLANQRELVQKEKRVLVTLCKSDGVGGASVDVRAKVAGEAGSGRKAGGM